MLHIDYECMNMMIATVSIGSVEGDVILKPMCGNIEPISVKRHKIKIEGIYLGMLRFNGERT